MKYLERYSFWLHLLGWAVFVFSPFLGVGIWADFGRIISRSRLCAAAPCKARKRER